MPRTAITAQRATSTGLDLTAEAANVDGNSVVQTGHRVLKVINGSAASINVTLPTPGTVDGLAVADRVVAVPAGATRYISVVNTAYRQPDGTVLIDYSAVATVTVAVLEAE